MNDNELKDQIEKELELIVCTYACTPYSQEFVINNFRDIEIDFIIEKELFWEVLQAQLRNLLMTYAANKKRKERERESKLTKEILEMEKVLAQEIGNKNWTQTLRNKKMELEEIREHKLKGALVRSRWQTSQLGEKPSNSFLNLENKNFISKHIREIKDGNKLINDPKQILEEMRKFYEKLFSEKKCIDIDETSLKTIKKRLPKLNEQNREMVEKEITLEELSNIVKKSKNNKSPGPDGYSNEFYKVFWPTIKILLMKLLNSYRNKNIVNPAQLEGIITCIPKGGKVRNILKNWRPITLLNSVYNFFSGIIANRIKNILPTIIHTDQKGFVNGRFIGENSRLLYDIIDECNKKGIDGLIMSIDFEKAFDSISWQFISKTLKKFNFGKQTINWIKSLQHLKYCKMGIFLVKSI